MESARNANQQFAEFYDEWNSTNDYEMWLGGILLPELMRHGLQKGWALDVGCGTGRAFNPLLGRGWQLVGCDVAPRMLARAAEKFGRQVQLLNLDARCLPQIVPAPGFPAQENFQLILLLNDVVNYLTEDGDLDRLLLGVKRNLSRERGLVIFDTNTLSQFRSDYSSDVKDEVGGRRWRGLAANMEPGAVFEGEFSGRGISPHIHRQRHWTIRAVEERIEASGLRCLAILGQRELGGRIIVTEPPREERDAKVVYIATHD
jgi:SAM-dependent methyltransferase